MKRRILIIVLLSLFLTMTFSNVANATNYQSVFKLTDYPGGSIEYSLTVSVTSSLYNYYVSQNHNLVNLTDYAQFITPYAVKPIADALRSVYSNDEVFADAVLSIAQQIPYIVSPAVYPAETLKLNYGDCASLSLLTASILEAGGLNVVLLEYPSQQHMNVGVNLPSAPVYARSTVYYVDYNGSRYYMAETTGDDFPNGWRVGECPAPLEGANPKVISIDGYGQSAPEQVSASFRTLSPSQISISVSSTFAMENTVINITGTVSPSDAENVSIYASSFGGAWQVLGTVSVDSNGSYAYQWRPQSGGIYYVQASWSGNASYAGADSQADTLYIIPFYAIAIALAMMLLVLFTLFWLINRRISRPPVSTEKPQTPSEPLTQEAQQSPQPTEQPQPAQSQTYEETTQTPKPQTNVQEASTSTEPTSPPQGETPQPAPETTTEPKSEPIRENPQPESPPTPLPSTEPQPQTTPPEQPQSQEQKQPEQPKENPS